MEGQQTEPTQEPKPQTRNTEAIVAIEPKGLMVFTNHKELHQAASIMCQLALAPEHLRKEGPLAVAAAMVFCKQHGLPQTAMNQCAYIKGKLTQYGSLITALAERHKDYGEKRQFFVDEEGNEICVKNKNLKALRWGAIIQIKKKGSTVWNEYMFNRNDCIEAGLITPNLKPDAAWLKYEADMMMHKCNSRAMKAEYASALEGINYHEDVVEVFEHPRDVTPKHNDVADDLNREYGYGEENQQDPAMVRPTLSN